MSSSSAINSLVSPTSSTNSAIDISNILAASSGSSTAGIDVTSAVTAAIYADNAPERAWLADQTTLSSQTTALTAIQPPHALPFSATPTTPSPPTGRRWRLWAWRGRVFDTPTVAPQAVP